MGFPAGLAQMLGAGMRQDERRPMDVLMFPSEKVEELCRMLDYVDEQPEIDREASDYEFRLEWGAAYRKHKMWTWLHQVLPACKGFEAKLDCTNPLAPRVLLYDRLVDPRTNPKFSQVFEIPEEHHQRVQELSVKEDLSIPGAAQARYNLWRVLHSLYPPCLEGQWALLQNEFGFFIVKDRLSEARELSDG